MPEEPAELQPSWSDTEAMPSVEDIFGSDEEDAFPEVEEVYENDFEAEVIDDTMLGFDDDAE